MRPCLPILFAVLLSGAASGAAPAETQAPGPPTPQAAPSLSALEAADQNAPDTLNGRLAYAEYLLSQADGACGARADAAQKQLDIVAAKPVFPVVMPLGPARAANLAYEIHSARAECGAEGTARQAELHAARDAALRAVDLYRDGFDYQSMVVMQFDAAAADREAGDTANAVARLRTAVAMDQAYGFRDDATENQALLQRWTGDAASSKADAAPAPAAPVRSVSLKFGWSDKDAQVSVAASYTDVFKDKVVHSRGSAQRTLAIRGEAADWVMSFPTNTRSYGLTEWPEGRAHEELNTLLLANIRLSSPGIRVDGKGDFKALSSPNTVSKKVADETSRLLRDILPVNGKISRLYPQLDRAVKSMSGADEMTAMAAEDYDLTTAEWIGAKLDQGVWYDMTAPLRAPGTAYAIDHDIQFAFTRAVPCTPAATVSNCIEIVLHATPNPEALGKWIAYMKPVLGMRPKQALRYWGGTDIRLVTDPDSLLTYVSDVRRHWYLSWVAADYPIVGAERIVSTSTYR